MVCCTMFHGRQFQWKSSYSVSWSVTPRCWRNARPSSTSDPRSAAGKAGHLQLTDEEQRAYDALTESLSPLDTELEALSERIAEMRTEFQRAGRDGSNPLLASIRGSGHTTDSAAASWA